MKNNTPGEDDVVVEAIKLGGEYKAIESLIEKSLEYNKPKALANCLIDLIATLPYSHSFHNCKSKNTDRGIRRHIPSKFFTTLLEYMFKKIELDNKGINVMAKS